MMTLQSEVWQHLNEPSRDFLVRLWDSMGRPKDSTEALAAIEAASQLGLSDRRLVTLYIIASSANRLIKRQLMAERHNRFMESLEVRQLSKIKPLRSQSAIALHVCVGEDCPICREAGR